MTQDAVPDLPAVGNKEVARQLADWIHRWPGGAPNEVWSIVEMISNDYTIGANELAALRSQVADLRGQLTAPTSAEIVESTIRDLASLHVSHPHFGAPTHAIDLIRQQAREIARLQDKVEQLRIIANVNGDWNIKYGQAVDRAERAEQEREQLHKALMHYATRDTGWEIAQDALDSLDAARQAAGKPDVPDL